MEERMRTEPDEQDEIAAAKERLKKFAKPASQCKNHHDPEQLARYRERREHAPHGVSWGELARTLRAM